MSAAQRRVLFVLMTALLVPIVPFVVIGELPGERWLKAAGDDALHFGLTGAALLSLDVLLPIPSSIVGALLGGKLGFVQGFVWAWSGLTAGNLIGYALGRLVPARWASPMPAAPTMAAVFLSRPVPVFAEALALTAGAERMAWLPFIASAAAGNLVYAAAMAADGAALLPDGLAGPGLIAPMLLPVIGYLAWRKLRVPAKELTPTDPT